MSAAGSRRFKARVRSVTKAKDELTFSPDEIEQAIALTECQPAAPDADAASIAGRQLRGLPRVDPAAKWEIVEEPDPRISRGTCTDCKKQDGPCWCGDTLGCTC